MSRVVSRVVSRLKRTGAAGVLRREVLRRRAARLPALSVVVPFHDSQSWLPDCLDSLDAQTYAHLQVVLVDDGSTEGSSQLAAEWARRRRGAVLVRQDHQGVGAARNAGVRAATGAYLAFCDSDDTVVAEGYARMVEALELSGSDLVVGSLTMQTKGRHAEPPWARRSNANRRLRTTLDEHPEVMANLLPGCRVFRRSFWDRAGLVFDEQGDHSDIVTVVRALLVSERLDILPAVVYRWWWHEDGRSLWQRGLRSPERVADRVRRIRDAGREVVELASEDVQSAFLTDILHTTVPELVRAAVAHSDGYWEALSVELRPLLDLLTPDNFLRVPFEDRVVAWMCAHDHRAVAEDFLEYAFDNQSGYPLRTVDGHPSVDFSTLEALPGAPAGLMRVADSEITFRSRLTALRWLRPGVLLLEGAALLEYVDDAAGDSRVTLLLRSPDSSTDLRVPTTPAPDLEANQWAGRAHEDHTGAGFRCELDVAALPAEVLPGPGRPRRVLEVLAQLEIAGRTVVGAFESRQVSGSAGLLEPSAVAGMVARPLWRQFEGLKLVLREDDTPPPDTRVEGPVRVASLEVRDGRVVLGGECDVAGAELCLIGPRGRSPWRAVRPAGPGGAVPPAAVRVALPLLNDEWGLGPTPLPLDRYAVAGRDPAGRVLAVVPTPELWRSLPVTLEDGDLQVFPGVSEQGALSLRVAPVEWRTSRAAYLRRRLRDEVYPAAREEPLLDMALFETFAGKAAGDNPGALCAELARRDSGIELVVSVMDRSVQVPAGARAVVRFSTEYFELLGRARYLIVNSALPYFFRKREGQLYVQTWHGSPLKRIAHDRPHLDFFNWHHRRQLLIARDGWDVLLSQSDFCTGALRSAFRYDGEVLEQGYPRNDVLSAPDADELRAGVRHRLGIADDERVILYAPTWRDNARVGRVFDKVLYLDPQEVVESIERSVVLVRGHYNSVRAAEAFDPGRRVIDLTRYPDIADLYLAADALVTDYSSVFFDFVLTGKPMIFLAPDLREYRDDNRGFYLDYHETVPGPVCLTTAEVVAELAGPDRFAARRKEFAARYAPHDDGHASARVIDAVLGWGERATGEAQDPS